jgi:hypothetical protein
MIAKYLIPCKCKNIWNYSKSYSKLHKIKKGVQKNEIPVIQNEQCFSSVKNPLKMERPVFSPKRSTMRKYGAKRGSGAPEPAGKFEK